MDGSKEEEQYGVGVMIFSKAIAKHQATCRRYLLDFRLPKVLLDGVDLLVFFKFFLNIIQALYLKKL